MGLISVIIGNASLVNLFDAIFVGIFIGLGITGILAYINYRKNAIIPTKQLLKWFALIALPIAIVPTLMVLLFAIPDTALPDNIGIYLGWLSVYIL